MALFSKYMYEVLDLFLPVIFAAIYFPFIMSKRTELVATKLWDWFMTVAFRPK